MAVALLADTQVVVWYLREPHRLTDAARSALTSATETGDLIGVSAFSIVELVYAAEKATNPFTNEDLDVVVDALGDPDGPFIVIPIDDKIAARVRSVPREGNADPGDRIIVASAEDIGAPLVSADRKVPAMTAIPVIW